MGIVSSRLRQIREARGLSLEVVADAINVRHSTLSRYERGKLKLDAELLPRLGEVLNVDPCLFLQGAISEQVQRATTSIPTVFEQAFPPAASLVVEDPLPFVVGEPTLAQRLARRIMDEFGEIAGRELELFFDFLEWRRQRETAP